MASDLRHVRREALPWRPPDTRTECGRTIRNSMPTMSRAQWREAYREWARLCAAWRAAGRQGTVAAPGVRAPNICQVCWETSKRWPTWYEDPAVALEREIQRRRDGRLALELTALIALYQEAPSRYAELLAWHTEAAGWAEAGRLR